MRGYIRALNQWYAEGRWYNTKEKILLDKQIIVAAGETW